MKTPGTNPTSYVAASVGAFVYAALNKQSQRYKLLTPHTNLSHGASSRIFQICLQQSIRSASFFSAGFDGATKSISKMWFFFPTPIKKLPLLYHYYQFSGHLTGKNCSNPSQKPSKLSLFSLKLRRSPFPNAVAIVVLFVFFLS